MKKSIFFLIVCFFAVTVTASGQRERRAAKVSPDTLKADSVSYELVVFDIGFDSWLATKPPANYYTQKYYEVWNQQYVKEWNYRTDHPIKYGILYDMKIEYDPFTDYGLDLNYKLYYYFKFFEEKNKVKLLTSSR
ncbi:MAG: DUF6146 family protein [Bacteroidales bacterium]